MAGYTLKIVIEDTHPPVWRRVTVPDKITFYDLHRLIQILFDWEDMHLHGFSTSKDSIVIDDENYSGGRHYIEKETLIDPFLREYKWIRYIYDFGDEWRHKIIFEKKEPLYMQRTASLLKWKGDQFCEDCGGVWGEVMRKPFLPEEVKKGLENYQMLVKPELKEPRIMRESMDMLREMFQNVFHMTEQVSAMDKMADEWSNYCSSSSREVTLSEPECRSRDYLENLDYVDAVNYCKYLQLSVDFGASQQERMDSITQCIQEYPEYILYVLTHEEYDELLRISKLQAGEKLQAAEYEELILKLIALGLAGFRKVRQKGEIRLAADLDSYLKNLDRKTVKRVYREIERFDQRFQEILCMYGMLELDVAYEVYQNYYGNSLDKEAFGRLIYWHASFQRMLVTGTREDGKAFICMTDLDHQKVAELQQKYAEEMSYVHFTLKEVQEKATNLARRSDWVENYFMVLHYGMLYPENVAVLFLERDVLKIMSGMPIHEILGQISEEGWDISVRAELWNCVTGMMLELELPMLKGRSREGYALEKDSSPWQTEMVEKVSEKNTRERHMYEFPEDIQQMIYEANAFGEESTIQKLLNYQKMDKICSEEFLYLLAKACISFSHFEDARKLSLILEKSSEEGKKAAQDLVELLEDGEDVVDDLEETSDWMWEPPYESQQPFVRQTPKIGRNDPCPCGSGKKYKKCCGRN